MLSIDWFIGMARALGNLIGNCVATVVIGAWKHDVPLARRVLAGAVQVDLTVDAVPVAAERWGAAGQGCRPDTAIGRLTARMARKEPPCQQLL